MAGAVEDIHSGFSLSSTGKWMPRMAAPLEAPNGCYSARTPAKLAMAGRMAGLLEPALAHPVALAPASRKQPCSQSHSLIISLVSQSPRSFALCFAFDRILTTPFNPRPCVAFHLNRSDFVYR